MRKLIIVGGFVFIALSMQAQEKNKGTNHRLGLEMGLNEFYGNTIVPDQVRSIKSVETYESSYNDDYLGGYDYDTSHDLQKLYVGVKYEVLFSNNTIGVSTGLRYFQASAKLNHNYRYEAFIWSLREDAQSSDYLSIRSINQKNHYVSIPLEIRAFPKKRDRFFKNYFKIGGALNYRFSTDYETDFLYPQMSKHAGEVESQIRKPCTFSGYIFPAMGFRWGRNIDPWVNLEFQFPGFLIAERKHAFVDPRVGFGVQLSVLFSLNKKTQ